MNQYINNQRVSIIFVLVMRKFLFQGEGKMPQLMTITRGLFTSDRNVHEGFF